GLAGAVRSDHRENATRIDAQVELADRGQTPEAHRELVDFNQRCLAHVSLSSWCSSARMRDDGQRPSGRKRIIRTSTSPKISQRQFEKLSSTFDEPSLPLWINCVSSGESTLSKLSSTNAPI